MPETIDEQPMLLTRLPPSQRQRRLAGAIAAMFIIAFAATLPFANTPLPRIDAWIPIYSTTFFINDTITAALLFSQFSIVRERAIQMLAIGYLFSALIVIPFNLAFPGLYAPFGLLGAGLQTTVWLYIAWHIASPLSVIAYALVKDAKNSEAMPKDPLRGEVVVTTLLVVAVVCLLTWIFTSHHNILPEIYRDSSSLAPLAKIFAALIFVLCLVALGLLSFRQRSVLDLWLMVTVFAWLLEITLQGLLLTDRFSLAWYMGRIFSLLASSVVLVVLLSETTTLYAHLARSAMRQLAARHARETAMDTMAASIAHEVSQPLGAIAANTEAALLLLGKTPPDTGAAKAALEDIAAASIRGNEIIVSLRSMFKKEARGRARCDVNNLIQETVSILRMELQATRISVSVELGAKLPKVMADRRQLQQVFSNLIMNARDAMQLVNDRTRALRIMSSISEDASDVIVTVSDSGEGISDGDRGRIFEAFFSTKSTGTGVGLTICRSIIDAHGGSVRVHENLPCGTTFEVLLPIERGNLAGI